MGEAFHKIRFKAEYLIVALIVALSIFSVFSLYKKSNSSAAYDDTQKYVSSLESKLEKTLSKVNGAGNVSVVITVDEGIASVVAKDEKTIDENGKKTTTTSTVLVGGKPLVLGERYPEITGVIVVSKGANDVIVKMSLLNAVTTALNVPCNKVQILAR